MSLKVCVIGRLSSEQNLCCGQRVKTRIIWEELQNRLGKDNVWKIDTSGGVKTLLLAPFQSFKALKNSENVVIIPAHNGVRVYAPLLAFIRRFFKKNKIYCVAVGGWLPEFLVNRKLVTTALKKFDGIYVQTNSMKRALETQGFENIVYMPNCKYLKILEDGELVYSAEEPYRLCTFSRVLKEKGIEIAVDAVKKINERMGRIVYTLDIFGKIQPEQSEWFESLKKTFPDYVVYRGVVPYEESVGTLKDFYALLFPTFYPGEGFPGTALDAFASGVPVIASDWRYNAEVIADGKTGKIISAKSVEALSDALVWLHENGDEWKEMKRNCLAEARKLRPEIVLDVLIRNMV